MKPLVSTALRIAKGEIGVRESNNNSGVRVEQYLSVVGLRGTHSPWCDAWVSWVIREAAKELKVDNPWLPSASCDVTLAWARSHEILSSKPEAGDCFLVCASKYDATHIGFVYELLDGGFRSIEGNSNSGGSREGIGVFSNRRPLASRYKYVRWSNLIEEAQPQEQVWELYLNDKKVAPLLVEKGVARVKAEDWAQAFGFELGWNAEAQTITLNGREVPSEVSLIDGKSWLPVRKLASFSGLKLTVEGRKVTVSH